MNSDVGGASTRQGRGVRLEDETFLIEEDLKVVGAVENGTEPPLAALPLLIDALALAHVSAHPQHPERGALAGALVDVPPVDQPPPFPGIPPYPVLGLEGGGESLEMGPQQCKNPGPIVGMNQLGPVTLPDLLSVAALPDRRGTLADRQIPGPGPIHGPAQDQTEAGLFRGSGIALQGPPELESQRQQSAEHQPEGEEEIRQTTLQPLLQLGGGPDPELPVHIIELDQRSIDQIRLRRDQRPIPAEGAPPPQHDPVKPVEGIGEQLVQHLIHPDHPHHVAMALDEVAGGNRGGHRAGGIGQRKVPDRISRDGVRAEEWTELNRELGADHRSVR